MDQRHVQLQNFSGFRITDQNLQNQREIQTKPWEEFRPVQLLNVYISTGRTALLPPPAVWSSWLRSIR